MTNPAPTLSRCIAPFLALVLWAVPAAAQLARIENIATLTYGASGDERTVSSNRVALEVETLRRPSTTSFRLPPPEGVPGGGACDGTTLVAPPATTGTIATAPIARRRDATQALFVVVEAPGADRDPLIRETVSIDLSAGEAHRMVRLTETDRASGTFAGLIPAAGDAAVAGCGVADSRNAPDDSVAANYPGDSANLPSSATVLVDPGGQLFSSADGAPVDGATVTLVDAAGQPATVFGDDGISRYPARVVSGAETADASGRRYPAVAGRYRFPLVAAGSYRLAVEPPAGFRAPSRADRSTLAALRGPAGRAYAISDASFGGPLALVDDPVTTDIPVDPAGPAVPLLLSKFASVREAAPGDAVQYRLQLVNRGKAVVAGLHLIDTLPAGLSYRRGSTRGGGEAAVAPDGRTLDFALPSLAAGATADVRYIVTIAPGARPGEALNRARATLGEAAASNEAAASVRIRPLLFTDALTIVGRVSEGACGDPPANRKGVAGIRLLLEDGTFTLSDRNGQYHFEGVTPGRHVVQIDTASIGATHEAIACDVDTRQAGSAISRFVEGEGGLLKRIDFQLRPTGKAAVDDAALPVAVASDAEAAGNRDWLPGQAPGTGWLFPAIDHNPRAPVLRVAIKHAPDERVALTVNGAAADALAFDGTDVAGAVAVSKWSGLPLGPGENRLIARVLRPDGQVAQVLERQVHLAGPPMRAVLAADKSRLVADGLTRPLLAVRVTDRAGHPVRAGTLVPIAVAQPYRAAAELDLEQGRQLSGRERAGTMAQVVGDDGYAFVALAPTTQAGEARVSIRLAEEKQVTTSEVAAWLAAPARDWVVVGFGAGSLGYDVLARHSRAARDRRGHAVDGQLALYAKGRIKGSWLLTLAYDSDRRYDRDRGLLGTIDPDRYYTVYGDGSAQGYDAATRRKLYLRLERRQAFALLGDFETGLTDAQLTRYSRTLNGVKAGYAGRRIRATAFAAKTDQRYRRDEIQGNGLSGPYRLTARGIVPNSDKLRIEVRDRFRSERIVSSTALTRHIDYDIDVGLGTVRFRSPVLSRDAALNPIFIVADYEVEGGGSGRLAAAGRMAARIGRVDIGIGAIRDETDGRASVVGADVKARLGRATELRAELAAGGRGGLGRGLAYLAEAEHHGTKVDALVYARQQDFGFGVGQQNLVEAGTRKFGFDGRVRLTGRLSLTGTGWFQDQLESGASRIAGEARLEWRRDTGTLFLGGQLARDRGLDRARDSRLITVGGTQALFGDRLTLTGITGFAPGGDKDSVDFPVRHQLNAALKVAKGVRLLGGYEIADGADFTSHSAQLGFDVAPWAGAKLTSTLNQQAIGENAGRTFAQYGLSQSLPIGKRWTIDATLDAANTVRGRIPAGAILTPFQPVASGGSIGQDQFNGDYAAATLGAAYRAARWSWNGRLEYRGGDSDRWGITSNVLRTLGEGRTLAGSIRAYRVADASGAVATYGAGDIALAWRPVDSRWSLLERLAMRHESADAGFDDRNVLGVPAYGAGDQVTTRIINDLALNYRTGPEGLGHGLEATLYHGAKYVKGRFARDRYDGFIDVAGFELRRDLGTRFDLGVSGSVQHAWTAHAWAWSGGPSVGVSPAGNVWVSAGYNIGGYRDRDFEADRYTRQGPYLTLRLKFDQLSLGSAARSIMGTRL